MDGRVIVVKVGGEVVRRPETVARETAALARRGYKVVLVHGGGSIVDEYSRRLGVEPRYVVSPSGVKSRYTTGEELEVYVMVMAGVIAPRLLAELSKAGVAAASASGLDGPMVEASRKERIVILNEKGRRQVIPGGYTGRITRVNTRLLEGLLGLVDVVVVPPIAWGGETPLNVDGDQMASMVASALRADLLLVTNVEGVLVDGEVVRHLTPTEAQDLAKRVGQGMNRKLIMAARAVERGSPRAVIGSAPIDGLLEGARGTVVSWRG